VCTESLLISRGVPSPEIYCTRAHGPTETALRQAMRRQSAHALAGRTGPRTRPDRPLKPDPDPRTTLRRYRTSVHATTMALRASVERGAVSRGAQAGPISGEGSRVSRHHRLRAAHLQDAPPRRAHSSPAARLACQRWVPRGHASPGGLTTGAAPRRLARAGYRAAPSISRPSWCQRQCHCSR